SLSTEGRDQDTHYSEPVRQCGLRPLGCVPSCRIRFRGTIRDALLVQVFACRLWVYSRPHGRALGHLALLRMDRSDMTTKTGKPELPSFATFHFLSVACARQRGLSSSHGQDRSRVFLRMKSVSTAVRVRARVMGCYSDSEKASFVIEMPSTSPCYPGAISLCFGPNQLWSRQITSARPPPCGCR